MKATLNEIETLCLRSCSISESNLHGETFEINCGGDCDDDIDCSDHGCCDKDG